MNIAIAGGTGLAGSALTGYLTGKGHHVYILTRNKQNKQNKDQITFVEWLSESAEPELHLPLINAYVNLAGASINSRWTKKHKKAILNSRIDATREIIRLISSSRSKPDVLINASAVGYYGISESDTFTEQSTPAKRNFLQEVCEKWELEASQAEKHGVRTVYSRFGLILDDKEGALPRMMLPYNLFAGGPIGKGTQWYSWVHLRDVVQMITFAIENNQARGPMNVVSPDPNKMKDFGKALAAVLNRPHWAPAPAFIIEKTLGEMSVLVVEGQKVLPENAVKWGYEFSFPHLTPALEDLLQ
ncbi:TIGR01777 family oxidoreductase [Alteribacillus sp. HJP-4]|uniref:TIGR01777 family oxidoreductase n=1 Tax=Alteribacillus sp. HJP-4 TaxID=2775394 RepID=UPI0035CD17B5